MRLLKAAKAKAREQLRHMPGVDGFGVGDGCVRVYVQDETAARRLPREIESVPLVAVISGPIHALR